MPFKKINTQKIFIGRINELNFFRKYILYPEAPAYNIVSISGPAGVGKTSLIAQIINTAHDPYFKDYCLTALADERQITAASIMEKFAEQLQIKGQFKRALTFYKEALRRQQNGRKSMQDIVLHKAPDLANAALESIPIAGPFVGEVVKTTTGHFVEKHHLTQVRRDAERLEDPIDDLTRAFVAELNLLAETKVRLSADWTIRKRRILLFFDTFEQLAAEATPWLLDHFLEADINKNVVLVVVGRYAIEHSTPDGRKRWLQYYDDRSICSFPLHSFDKDETCAYLDKRGITDIERIDTIWKLSRGLPFYLGLLTSNSQGEVDPTKDVVDNFLRWIPEEEHIKRRLAQDAALFSKPFNQDDLAAFASYVTENDRAALYHWLADQPFVQQINPWDGRHVYHELAQELFSRHLFQRSKKGYYATRRDLANHYQQLLEEEAGNQAYNPAERLELTLALAYQLFLLPHESNHIKAIELILKAYEEHAEQTGDIIKVLHELYKDQLKTQMSNEVREAVWKLLEYMGSDQTSQTFLASVSYLIKKVGLEPLFSPNTLATMYQMRGYTYGMLEEYQRTIQQYDPTNANVLDFLPALFRERADAYVAIEEYQRAIVDYNRALKLEPRYVQAYIHRGIAYRNLKEYDQAITDFDYALRLEAKNALAFAERGRTYRLLNNYEWAIVDFTDALKLYPEDARTYADRGMAYLLLNDIRRAKADFNKSWKLNPNDINACWMAHWSEMCQKKENPESVELLMGIISFNQQHYVAHVCKGIVLWIQRCFDEALETLDWAILSMPDAWDAYFWKGMMCASVKRDIEAFTALEQALALGLPPVLLTPLHWLERERPDFYERYRPLLLSH